MVVVATRLARLLTQPSKQKKRPAAIITTHTAATSAGQLTPQGETDKLNCGYTDQVAPKNLNPIDSSLDSTHQDILRQDLSINDKTSEPKEWNSDYHALQYLIQV